MNDSFEIPVIYQGKHLHLNAELLAYGYTHKIRVEINKQEVLFEPDEECKYRAVIKPIEDEKHHKIDIELLKAIAGSLDEILR